MAVIQDIFNEEGGECVADVADKIMEVIKNLSLHPEYNIISIPKQETIVLKGSSPLDKEKLEKAAKKHGLTAFDADKMMEMHKTGREKLVLNPLPEGETPKYSPAAMNLIVEGVSETPLFSSLEYDLGNTSGGDSLHYTDVYTKGSKTEVVCIFRKIPKKEHERVIERFKPKTMRV